MQRTLSVSQTITFGRTTPQLPGLRENFRREREHAETLAKTRDRGTTDAGQHTVSHSSVRCSADTCGGSFSRASVSTAGTASSAAAHGRRAHSARCLGLLLNQISRKGCESILMEMKVSVYLMNLYVINHQLNDILLR